MRDSLARAWALAQRISEAYLTRLLAFIALLLVVVLIFARLPQDCDCPLRKAQIILTAAAGLVSLVGTFMQARYAFRLVEDPSDPGVFDNGGDEAKAHLSVALIGLGVVLGTLAGLLGFLDQS